MQKHEVIFRGGLGNQIFCLYEAYKIFLKYKNKVCLNLNNYSISKRKDRSFILNNLYPPLFEEFEISSSLFSNFLFYYSRIHEKIFIRNRSNRLPGDKTFSINYFPNMFLYSGYFQKIDNSNLEINFIKLMKNKFSPYLSCEKNNNLAIHLRRGDYLHKGHSMHGIILEEFLIREAKRQLSKNDFNEITIFSDSPELINLELFLPLNKKLIIDRGGDPIQVFKRMSNHKGLIASNSSFSLWAGILGHIQNFSIPYYWMKNVKSSVIGLKNITRYECFL